MKSVEHCRHVKEDGIACGSPPLSGESHCHFQLRYKGRRLRTWRARRTPGVKDMRLPPPDDFHAILFSLNKVAQALASGRLGPHEAGKILRQLDRAGARLRGEILSRAESAQEATLEASERDCTWIQNLANQEFMYKSRGMKNLPRNFA